MVPLPLFMIITTSGRRKESITTEDGAEGDQEGEGVVTMEVAGVVVMGLIMVMVAAMVMDMVAGVVTMKMRMNIMSLKNMPLQLVGVAGEDGHRSVLEAVDVPGEVIIRWLVHIKCTC